MKFKDYYKTLGVERDASAEEIKKTFRKLVRKHHPDLNKAPDAQVRMQEINEANDVLSDKEKRLAYDTLARRQEAGQEFAPPPGWADGFEFSGAANSGGAGFSQEHSDFFEALFGSAARGRGGSVRAGFGEDPRAGGYEQPLRGSDHHSKMTIPLDDSFTGAMRELTLRSPELDASGQVILRERTLQVNIPKGVYAGQQIRLANQGAPGLGAQGMGDGPPGDLYLEIAFLPHPLYRPEGRDLYVSFPLAPWELVLGAMVNVPTPGGVVEMSIPPNSQAGKKMRLRGRGIPAKEPGDEYLLLEVALPPASSEQARAFYQKMSEELAFNPRSHLGV
jgi:curved DNA-binding protein